MLFGVSGLLLLILGLWNYGYSPVTETVIAVEIGAWGPNCDRNPVCNYGGQ